MYQKRNLSLTGGSPWVQVSLSGRLSDEHGSSTQAAAKLDLLLRFQKLDAQLEPAGQAAGLRTIIPRSVSCWVL